MTDVVTLIEKLRKQRALLRDADDDDACAFHARIAATYQRVILNLSEPTSYRKH